MYCGHSGVDIEFAHCDGTNLFPCINNVCFKRHGGMSSSVHALLFIPYSDLLSQFEELRSADGCYVEALGELLLRWVRHVYSYT